MTSTRFTFLISIISVCLVCLICLVGFAGCGKDDQNPQADFEPIKPAATVQIEYPKDDPTMRDHDKPDLEGDAVRKRSIATLTEGGFIVSQGLPTSGHRRGVAGKLRPTREIALRLMALNALFMWASAPEAAVKSEELQAYIKRNNLLDHLSLAEQEIISLSRTEANKQHAGSVGWRLENMWSLAWALGFEKKPDPMLGQIPNEVTKAMVMKFMPGLDSSVDDLLKKAKPRSLQEVIQREDIFYCSHNAVRSAQTGSKTVPDNFHPIRDGGAIHERRHGLTWILSPDVRWDDTDLST
ncbi:DUF4272 domain-containing protein [bacterium]|nr:DUF4272 domain-containing protein [bacterium]